MNEEILVLYQYCISLKTIAWVCNSCQMSLDQKQMP